MSKDSMVLKILQERGGAIRFVTALEDGKYCWFYLTLHPEKAAEYERLLRTGEMNIRDYGEILESDWGRYPPPDVIRFMRDEYGFETPENTQQ